MKKINNLFEPLSVKSLSQKTKEKSGRIILTIAIVSFILHLLLILPVRFQLSVDSG